MKVQREESERIQKEGGQTMIYGNMERRIGRKMEKIIRANHGQRKIEEYEFQGLSSYSLKTYVLQLSLIHI